MKKLKTIISKLKSLLTGIYTGRHPFAAAAVTVTAIAALSVSGIIIIKSFTSHDDVSAGVTPPVREDIKNSTEWTLAEETSAYTEVLTEPATEETSPVETTATEIVTEEISVTVPETIPLEEISTVPIKEAEDFNPQEEARQPQPVQPSVPLAAKPSEPQTEKPVQPPKVNEVAKTVSGIDVSRWQGDIDWTQVKNDGIDFAIIRVGGRSTGTKGDLYTDDYFTQNIEGALANGIPVGIYFFSQAINEREAREEASLVIGMIKKYKITYPVAFDWETAGGYRTSNVSLSKNKMDSIASTFCDMIKSAGYTPMIYGSTWDFISRYNTEIISSKYKIWMANYPGWNNSGKPQKYNNSRYRQGDEIPSGAGYPSFQMWQYTSQGRVKGIKGNVDLNVGFFTYNGTEVPTTPIKLEVKNTVLTVNTGENINLLKDVTGFNSAGIECTSDIKYRITDSSGAELMEEAAFNSPGEYTVTYTLKDFTGAGKSVSVKLTVTDTATTVPDENENLTDSENNNENETDTGNDNDNEELTDGSTETVSPVQTENITDNTSKTDSETVSEADTTT